MENGLDGSAKILVVDDQEQNAQILEQFLQPKGYDVTSVHSGKAALRCVDRHPPDVILLDLVMPDMDGFEVCQRLKRDRKTHHIPIIIITGLAEKEANIRALEAGANDFLVKPFDVALLNARIRSSLQSKMLQDQVIEYQRQLEEANETLEKRIQKRTAQLARTQQVTVFSLAKLAESRDTETGAHLERMRSYARGIAAELVRSGTYGDEAGEDLPEQIFLSSPLHDIGKVGIPDSILLKPGKLTPQEFDIMKTHSLIGGDTLRAADLEAGQESFLAMGRDIAYYHHERWDGNGYPFGLAGTNIPLAARIVAVSDVYDALTSKRPYKEAYSHETSRDLVLEGRKTAFDPAVVDAFAVCEDRIVEIRESLQDLGTPSPLQRLNQLVENLRGQELKAVSG